jgi:hypothetical protein
MLARRRATITGGAACAARCGVVCLRLSPRFGSGVWTLTCCAAALRCPRAILERELETVGLRLNKTKPDVVIEPKASGGVKFSHTVPLTKLGPEPGKIIYSILHEYKMHNVHVVVRQDISVDEFIDVIEGNRKYIRCLYVYNKVRSRGIAVAVVQCFVARQLRRRVCRSTRSPLRTWTAWRASPTPL